MATITDELIADLKRDEGCRLKAYRCTQGVLTIGYGHTASVKINDIWTQAQAVTALVIDAKIHADELIKKLPWVTRLSQVRQDVLFNMAFNLGVDGLLEFKKTLKQIVVGNYATASVMMLQSLWARQVGMRANRLAAMMKSGVRAK